VTLDKIFYSLLFKQEVAAAPSYSHIFFLTAFPEEAFIRNIIIMLCINYIVIIFMDDDNKAIINNCGRIQELMLIFQIPMGMQKNFFAMNSLFGHAPSEVFANPGLNFLGQERERGTFLQCSRSTLSENFEKWHVRQMDSLIKVSYGEAAYRAIPGEVNFGWNACCSGAGD